MLQHHEFLDGYVHTDFIYSNPELLDVRQTQNRANKLLYYLGEVIVNGPPTPFANNVKPSKIVPVVPEVCILQCWK